MSKIIKDAVIVALREELSSVKEDNKKLQETWEELACINIDLEMDNRALRAHSGELENVKSEMTGLAYSKCTFNEYNFNDGEQLAISQAVSILNNHIDKTPAQSLAKVRADAIRDAKETAVFKHGEANGMFGNGFEEAIIQYDKHMDQYANKIEAGL